MNIDKINFNTNSMNYVSFGAKPSKTVEDVTTKVFDKLFSVKGNNLRTYLGTTLKGDNITIRETNLGKSADLYVSYAKKKLPLDDNFKVFHVEKSSNAPSTVLSDDGKKLPAKEVKKVQRILDTLV